MDILEIIKTRRSIRSFKREPIPEKLLADVLDVAPLAPSASNRQEYKFIIVQDETLKKALVPVCRNQSFVGEAPVVLVGCATNPERRYSFVDVAIAMDHMTLAAHAFGLGTCWIGAFNEEEVKRLLGIPETVTVVCLLALGLPAEKGAAKDRKSHRQLFSENRW